MFWKRYVLVCPVIERVLRLMVLSYPSNRMKTSRDVFRLFLLFIATHNGIQTHNHSSHRDITQRPTLDRIAYLLTLIGKRESGDLLVRIDVIMLKTARTSMATFGKYRNTK